MNPRLISILIVFVCLCAILLTTFLYKRRKLATLLAFFWLLIWTLIGFFSLFPDCITYVVSFVGMRFKISFLFILSTIFLLFLILYLSVEISKAHRNIRKLTQELAITNYRLETNISPQNNEVETDE
ncbi:MAG: DUF2304 domain-containing protein [Deltaproteobacteria bacterium]|nr:DUF2304 domain-containing protein [Deltaproteobacteria bacterium]